MSPTQRTLAKLRKEWPYVAVTEHWNQYAHIRQDLFSFIDVICFRDDELLAVQCTTGPNVAARINKIRCCPAADHWIASPSRRLEVWGWRKIGDRGKRKMWSVRRVWVRPTDTVEITEVMS